MDARGARPARSHRRLGARVERPVRRTARHLAAGCRRGGGQPRAVRDPAADRARLPGLRRRRRRERRASCASGRLEPSCTATRCCSSASCATSSRTRSRTPIAAGYSWAAVAARKLRVQVRDTGRGIAPSEQQHVFQEFYQIGNPERDRTRGVGLGLAIVKRLTTLLDHPLQLRFAARQGHVLFRSTFLTPRRRLGLISACRTRSRRRIARGSGLILVVDDEGAIQVAMKSLLQSWGYSVIVAGSFARNAGTHRDVSGRAAPHHLRLSPARQRNRQQRDRTAAQRIQRRDSRHAHHRRHGARPPQGSAGQRLPAAAQTRAERQAARGDRAGLSSIRSQIRLPAGVEPAGSGRRPRRRTPSMP